MCHLARATLLALCAASAPALDYRVADLRVGVGTFPLPSEASEDYGAGAGSTRPDGSYGYDGNLTPGIGVKVGMAGGRLQPAGLILGIELQGALGTFDLSGGSAPNQRDLSYWALIPTVRAGLGYAPSTRLHLEVTPVVGYGLARTEWSDAGASESSFGGVFVAGLTATAMQRLGRGWSAGVEVGYLWSWTRGSVTNGRTDGSSDVDLDGAGPVANLILGYTF